MPILKSTAFAVVALLTATGFSAQPALSQTTGARSADVQLAQTPAQTSEHKAAALQLYQLLELDVAELQKVAATGSVEGAIAGFESKARRPLTDREYQQMFDFWYRQFQEILSQQNVENAIAAVYMENFTLEELTEINQLADPMAQIASPALGDDVEAAVVAIADRYLMNEVWVNRIAVEMIEALPFLAEQYGPVPGAS